MERLGAKVVSEWPLLRVGFVHAHWNHKVKRNVAMTVPASVSDSIQTLQVWLKELRDKGELADEAAAYSVLRSVLHQLRDRLTLEEAVDPPGDLELQGGFRARGA